MNRFIIALLALTGCAGVHVAPAPDATPCPVEADAGELAPPARTQGRISGLAACQTLALRAAAYDEPEPCLLECPWALPSRPSEPRVDCDPAGWEACFQEAMVANTCVFLEAALAECDPDACEPIE